MLSGRIIYYKPKVNITVTQQTPPTNEKHWSKKYCLSLIESFKKKGYDKGAKVVTAYNKEALTIIGFMDVPEQGYKWTHYQPCLVQCQSVKDYKAYYRYDELALEQPQC